MKKKMISMFLAAMMTFSLGIVTYAADPETKSDLQKDSYGTEACDNSGEDVATQEYVRTKLRVNGKNVILEGGKQVGDMPDGMSYDDSTNTLTLNNCTLEQTDSETLSAIEFDSCYYSGNICGTKLTIVLIGDNTIYAPGSVGIKTGLDDSVTIKGGGSLNIIHDSRCALSPYTNYFTGIEIGGRAGDDLDSSALTIESCNINISADTEGEEILDKQTD